MLRTGHVMFILAVTIKIVIGIDAYIAANLPVCS